MPIRLTLLFVSLAGCASTPSSLVRVTSEPPASTVTIVDPDGNTVTSQQTPFDASIDFAEGLVFDVTAVPPEESADFVKTRTRVDESHLTPTGRKGRFDLRIDLARRDFEEMPVLELALHPTRGLVGVIGTRRAFDSEESVGGPREVIEMDEHAGVHGLAISRSGSLAVYSTVDIDDEAMTSAERVVSIEDADISVVDLTGPGIRRESDDRFVNMYPSFTIDGESLVYSTNRLDDEGADIARRPASSFSAGETFLRTDENDTWRFLAPTQGAPGDIIHSAYPFDWTGPGDLRKPQIQAIGGRAGAFPVEHTTGHMPAVSPDGRRIAFIREGDLFVYDTTRQWTTRLTHDAAWIVDDHRLSLSGAEREFFEQTELDWTFFANANPSWSADGVHILYTSRAAADPTGKPNEDIWVVRADGVGEAEQLTTNPSSDRFGVVTPDRNWVYFVSNRDKTWALWRMPTRGTMLDPSR